jgi:transposase, IS5 family
VDEIEHRYAALFKNKRGNVAKPLRLALGACIIQAEYSYSDGETVLQIQETPYLQFFCGFTEYVDARPFDSSLMVYFRKRLTPEILGEINELIIQKALQEKKETVCQDDDKNNHDKPEPPQNGGTLIVDATCAPSQIKYPQDTELLNEARENTEEMIDAIHDPVQGKRPRTYRKKAHKNYLKFARSRRRTGKQIRKSVKQQLGYLRRNLEVIDRMLVSGKVLTEKHQKRLQTVRTLYEQQNTCMTTTYILFQTVL